MIYENLFETALIKPYEEGADNLKIISGYATSAMAFNHFEKIKALGGDINVTLLVGMCPDSGMSISNHRGFQKMMDIEYPGRFSCSYIFKNPPVHSKLYIWSRGDKLYKSFIGSANYTQTAFFAPQEEILVEAKSDNVLDYYDKVDKRSIFCNHIEADGFVQIYKDRNYSHRSSGGTQASIGNEPTPFNVNSVESIDVSLLTKRGEIQQKAGLNWGQRGNRNPNQAYIQLPAEVYRSDFFPKRSIHFTVHTDDNKTLICTRAQKDEDGQAIHTPHNNSLIGEYFRHRLGLANGAFITKKHLERYGRSNVTFYKFDEENYYMDFSVNK